MPIPWSEVGEDLLRWGSRDLTSAGKMARVAEKFNPGGHRPADAVLMDLEERTGLPFWQKAKDVIVGNERAMRVTAARDELATRALKGFRKNDYEDAMHVIFGPTIERPTRDVRVGATKLNQAAKAVFDTLEEPLKERGVTVGEHVANVKRLRQSVDPLSAFPNGIPDSLQVFAGPDLGPHEANLAHFLAQHNRAFAMADHVQGPIEEMRKLADSRGVQAAHSMYVKNWIGQVQGTRRELSEKFNPILRKALSYIGVKHSEADLHRMIDTASTLTYANLVGYRPAPLIRNLFNSLQTGAPRIGIPYWWEGVKQSFTKEGQALASKAGMTGEVMEEMHALHKAVDAGTPSAAIRSFAEVGLKPYGKIDDWNRSHIFLGMRHRVLKAMPIEDEAHFLRASGVDKFHQLIREEVLNLRKMGQNEEAAATAGKWAAYHTQWNYSAPFKPAWLSSEKARVFGQFGVWPSNYLEYLRQMTTMPMQSESRKEWIRDWVVAQGAIALAFGGVGATVGMGLTALKDTAKWTGVGPLNYAGGPATDALMALPKIYNEMLDGKMQEFHRVVKNIGSIPTPGYGAIRDMAATQGSGYDPTGPLFGKDVFPDRKAIAPSASPEEAMFRLLTGSQKGAQ